MNLNYVILNLVFMVIIYVGKITYGQVIGEEKLEFLAHFRYINFYLRFWWISWKNGNRFNKDSGGYFRNEIMFFVTWDSIFGPFGKKQVDSESDC